MNMEMREVDHWVVEEYEREEMLEDWFKDLPRMYKGRNTLPRWVTIPAEDFTAKELMVLFGLSKKKAEDVVWGGDTNRHGGRIAKELPYRIKVGNSWKSPNSCYIDEMTIFAGRSTFLLFLMYFGFCEDWAPSKFYKRAELRAKKCRK